MSSLQPAPPAASCCYLSGSADTGVAQGSGPSSGRTLILLAGLTRYHLPPRGGGDLSACEDQHRLQRGGCASRASSRREPASLKDFAPGHRRMEKPLLSGGGRGGWESRGPAEPSQSSFRQEEGSEHTSPCYCFLFLLSKLQVFLPWPELKCSAVARPSEGALRTLAHRMTMARDRAGCWQRPHPAKVNSKLSQDRGKGGVTCKAFSHSPQVHHGAGGRKCYREKGLINILPTPTTY